MKVLVHLPGPLVALAGGAARVEVEAARGTVGDALGALFALHPRLRLRIVDELGRVRPHVNVFVGPDSIRDEGGLDRAVPEGATLSVIAAVSGGSQGS